MPSRVRIIFMYPNVGAWTGRRAVEALALHTVRIRKKKDESNWQYAKRAWDNIPNKENMRLWIIREPRGTKNTHSLYIKTLKELKLYARRRTRTTTTTRDMAIDQIIQQWSTTASSASTMLPETW